MIAHGLRVEEAVARAEAEGPRHEEVGLRFLLRALLMLSGHVVVDPDEAHKEEIGAHAAGSV